MDTLLEAIADIASNAPPEQVEQLASQIRSLEGPEAASSLSSWAVNPRASQRLKNLVEAWRKNSVPSGELAGMMIGASHALNHLNAAAEVELVWTGPTSALVATRKTEQALLQVIKTARKKFFLTSFVAYDVGSILTALAEATERGVEISMLLESSDAHGGGVSVDAIGHMKRVLPSAKVFYWGEKTDAFAGGKVHAKVAVADEVLCFLSSANLTGHAMEKNMEAGVLIRGGDIPRKLHQHLEALITTKILERA